MKNNEIKDYRRIKLEHINQKDYIGFLQGRPDREKVISSDDIINLKILLNSSQTIEECLQKL